MYKIYMTTKTKGANITKTEICSWDNWKDAYGVMKMIFDAVVSAGVEVNKWSDEDGYYLSYSYDSETEVLYSIVNA